MKKAVSILMVVMMIFSLAACGQSATNGNSKTNTTTNESVQPSSEVSIEEYDTIFIGYPIWWHTAPMIIGTFLESFDLSGKDVYPFTQSASMDTEQFENSMEFVRECAEEATVHDGLFVNASDADGIFAYLTENGFAE